MSLPRCLLHAYYFYTAKLGHERASTVQRAMGDPATKKQEEDTRQMLEVRAVRVVLLLPACAISCVGEGVREGEHACAHTELRALAGATQYFALIGWMDEDAITDDRLHKLLKRGIALKKVRARALLQCPAGV